MGQTDLKPTAQGQVESSINDTINFIMAKVAAGEIDAATATELIAAARKDYESNVPVTTSAQQAVQLQQTANPYQADPQTAYAVPEMEPEQTPIDYGQFATSTNYPHTYDVEDSSDVDMDALSITGWSDLGYDSPTYLYKRNNGLQDAYFGLGVYYLSHLD